MTLGEVIMEALLHPIQTFRGTTRKRKVASLTVLGSLLLVSAAVAYYVLIAAGSYNGTQPLTATGGSVTLTDFKQSFSLTSMAPGDQSVVTITADNPTTQRVNVNTVDVTIPTTGQFAGFQAAWSPIPRW
jgi:hypothetical protein